MPPRHGRRDRNHAAIRDGLRGIIGKSAVADTADVRRGFPDLVAGWKGRTYMFEVKMPGEPLTPDEVRFRDSWPGHYAVVYTLQDALAELGLAFR